ncbi:hypothetical protein H0H87_005994 [Tephrocybe sp. NHM501043]|nr:hypothetical protein H0H87_005994 [Tephrocybe sp. NHM501043]
MHEHVLNTEAKYDAHSKGVVPLKLIWGSSWHFRCIEYQARENVFVKATHISRTPKATLLAAKNEATDDALLSAVVKILEKVPSSKVKPEGYQNCLDFAVAGLHLLKDEKYVSPNDCESFDSFKREHGKTVYDKTAPEVINMCKRGLGGGCNKVKKGRKETL